MSKAEKQIFAAIGITVLAGAALPVVVEVAVSTAISVASSSTISAIQAYVLNAAAANGVAAVEVATMALGGSTMPTVLGFPTNSGKTLSFADEAASQYSVASSAGGKTLPMTVEKILPQGSKITDVVNDVKAMTWMTGNEHAVVRLANGQKAIVSGGSGGISFQSGQIKTLFGHSHPTSAPPSFAVSNAFRFLVQSRQYVIHGGQTTLIRP